MNKKLAISLIFSVCVIGILCASQVRASDASVSAKQALQATSKTGHLQTQAVNEIDRRLASLSKLIGLINSAKRLTPDTKNILGLQIQSQISSLNALKTKVSTDSASVDVKTDVESIKSAYRVYALYLPKMHIIITADLLNQVADKLSALSVKLQSRLEQADTNGKDVTTLQSDLTDLQIRIADLSTQTKEATASVIPLTPDGWPANQPTLKSARTNLTNARKDAETARTDIHQIIAGLQSLKPRINSNSASPSASASSAANTVH